jgi:hypothetical protein
VVAYALTLSTPPEMIAAGQALFEANCLECHQPPLDAARLAGLTTAAMYKTVTNGVDKMPAYSNLSEAERWQVTAYMRSLTFSSESAASATAIPATEAAPTLEAITPLSPTAPISGTIAGMITHAAGGTTPAGLPVTLYAIDNTGTSPQIAYTLTAVTDEEGAFGFTNVDLGQGQLFGAGLEYQGALYGSRIATVVSDTVSLDLSIEIYDSTTDTSGLVAERVHFIFTFDQPGQASVMEIYAISNPTDKTVVSSVPGGPVAVFTLPAGAANLTLQDGQLGGRYQMVPGGFADTEAIYPGSGDYQVAFSYTLPYEGKLDFVQSVALNTAATTVLVPNGSVTVQGLQDAGLYEGTDYHRYDSGAINPGGEIRFTVRGTPGQGQNPLASLTIDRQNLMIGLGSLGLVLVALGVWLYQRNKSQPVEAPGDEGEASEAEEDGDTLMDAILALDDQYQAGQIPEEAYRSRRAELKARLRALLGS